MPRTLKRRLPIGSELIPGEGVHFRVWAPSRKRVAVVVDEAEPVLLDAENGGYFSGTAKQATEGSLYFFRLDDIPELFPDPASRFQPMGPDGPSQVVNPHAFGWTDANWKGVRIPGQVIYEMHVGTFTQAGTWEAAQSRLSDLADLGVTIIELMPIADFAGAFGWGYDGVNFFAPTRLYGTPDDFRAFVDAAHQASIGVILDVVYNHFGPDGNHIHQFSSSYFSNKYENEWGEALNFDGADAPPVREFITSNARYWISEFHLDGLRLDATQQIFDDSPDHIVAALTREARDGAGTRSIVIVGENEVQDARYIRDMQSGGYGIDGLWNDDFHHAARVAATGHNEAYYSDYRGSAQELISAVRWGFLYQGQHYSWQKKSRGAPALDIPAPAFVLYLQNHDQVANSIRGERLHRLTTPGRCRALTALMLLAPGTPMLFQGQEFAASAPFLYFAQHQHDIATLVVKGRAKFLSQFPSIAAIDPALLDVPYCEETFLKCKLDHTERETNAHIVALHRDLLRMRRDDAIFARQQADRLFGTVITHEAFALRFSGNDGDDRLLIVNLGASLRLDSIADPLVAPPPDAEWLQVWSSEDTRYGGGGSARLWDEDNRWNIAGHSAMVLTARTT